MLAVALAGVLSFLGGGYIVTSAGPAVLVYLAAAALWLALTRPALPKDPLLLTGLAGLAALALWSGLSVLWSVGPDLSWVAFNYAALYAAVATLTVLAGWSGWGARLAGYGYLLCSVAVAVYALLGKVLPETVTHAHDPVRLQQPLGYWNVLAIVLVMGVPLALSAAARAGLPATLRAAAAAAVSLLLLTLFFTFSRGGFLALAVCLIVFFAAARSRLSAFVSLLLAAAPVVLVLLRVRGLASLFSPTTDDVLRTVQGHALGRWALVALGAAAALQLGVCAAQRVWRPRPVVVRLAGAAVLAVVLLVAVGGPLWHMSRQGGVRHWISSRYQALVSGDAQGQGDTVGRLLVVSTNGRIELFREALQAYPHNPVAGTGAGTFWFLNNRYRPFGLVVRNAHSQWFNALAELGVVGVALLAVGVLALLAAAVRGVWRARRERERQLLAACLAAAAAFSAHMSVDWDWDMSAATVAFLLLTATAAVYPPRPKAARARVTLGGRTDDGGGEDADAEAGPLAGAVSAWVGPGARSNEGEGGRTAEPDAAPGGAAGPAAEEHAGGPAAGWRDGVSAAEPAVGAVVAEPAARRSAAQGPARRLPLWAALAGAVLLLALAASWLFPYLSLRAQADALAKASSDPATALARAQRAHRLDPLAVDPLITTALLQQQLGHPEAALRTLRRAVRLQPQNYRVYYQLGLLLTVAFDETAEARAAFLRALALNPRDDLSLDQLRRLEGRP